jgi:hypothetical protein
MVMAREVRHIAATDPRVCLVDAEEIESGIEEYDACLSIFIKRFQGREGIGSFLK